MSNNIIIIDPSIAGISGDMLLSASVDLGANEESTIQTILSIKNYFTGCKKLEVNFSNVIKNGFRAKKINIEIEETTTNYNVTTLTRNFNECLSSINISSKAREFAEKIRHQVNDLVLPSSQRNHGITISLGVAEKQPDEPLMEAIKRADRSLYAAKRQGKNQTFIQ